MRNILSSFVVFLGISFGVQSQSPTMGLMLNDTASFNGYTLFSPNSYNTTYLIDNCGNEINRWESLYSPRLMAYLLENGDLIRCANNNNPVFALTGGSGGRIELFNWNGVLLWSYLYSDSIHQQHHDVEYLPNGNILVIAWEYKTVGEAISAGRDPALLSSALWPDHIIEIEPIGSTGANIVWEWHAWDHLIQDFDSGKSNFGVVADHPELINLNFSNSSNQDWLHTNSIDYNPDLDQILMSVHNFNEIWIIDHSTSTAEAASHLGGNSGRGGDLLYRWGNPRAYKRGTQADQKLWGQHDAHWIETGLFDAGKIMVFNNGLNRIGGNYSSVEVIDPPIDSLHNYQINGSLAFGPNLASWQYIASPPSSFYSSNISGAHRLENTNTLICEGASGRFFEVDTAGNTVWTYINPVNQAGPMIQGSNPIGNSVFRAVRYSPDYSAFNGRTLSQGPAIELNPLPSSCTLFTGIQESEFSDLRDKVLLFPNPFDSELVIRTQHEESINIIITDLSGRICLNTGMTGFELKLSTSGLSQGTYLVIVQRPGSRSVNRIVKI
jgi:DNA-binding beta-propeller fold protein YncE